MDPTPGLKPRTVQYVHTILDAVLKDAMPWGRVARNVADAADPPSAGSAPATRPGAWTAEQLGSFLDFTAHDRYLPAWMFLATTGCRRGECRGLKWSDLDLDRGTAVISRQLTAVNHEVRIKDTRQHAAAPLPRLVLEHGRRAGAGSPGKSTTETVVSTVMPAFVPVSYDAAPRRQLGLVHFQCARNPFGPAATDAPQ